MHNVSAEGLIRFFRRIESVRFSLQETWHRQEGKEKRGNLHHHQPSAADLNLHIPIAFLPYERGREMHFSLKLIKVAHE